MEATDPPPFEFLLRVRYGECDAQRVVFNSRYGDYVDAAITEFMRALGYGAAAAAGELEYQLVRQVFEWTGSARFDQVLALAVQTVTLGSTSFTMRTTVKIAGSEAVVATIETVYVLIDPATFRKQSLPETFRAALQAGARGICVDHAGFGVRP